ncbi:MAG: hypothetical protein EOR95_30150 [Mesorhizobium sp.]|nr:MAG: hypothetical protein EOR95_30150 [Mesorhizobium sp.]
MNIHKNARLTSLRREEMACYVVEGRLSKADAARTYGVTAKVVACWVDRFRVEGSTGMIDRSSRPKTSPKQTEAAVADAIVALRRQHLTGKHIAMQAGVSEATVSRVRARAGLSRLKDPEPAEPVSASIPVSSSISISRSSAGSALWGPASPGDIPARSTAILASAGSSSTSASTMPHASLSSKSRPAQGELSPPRSRRCNRSFN